MLTDACYDMPWLMPVLSFILGSIVTTAVAVWLWYGEKLRRYERRPEHMR